MGIISGPISVHLRVTLTVLVFLLLLVCWFATSSASQGFLFFLPTPSAFIGRLQEIIGSSTFYADLFATLERFFISAVIGVLAALLLGTVIQLNGYAQALAAPILTVASYVPILVVGIVLLLVLGIDDRQKIAFVSLGILVQLLPYVRAGLSRVEDNFVRIGRCAGLGGFELVWRVYLPRAAPLIYDGARAAFGFSWSFIVMSEILGGSNGIGLRLDETRRYFQVDRMWVYVAVISGCAALLDLALGSARRKIFSWDSKGGSS